MAITIDPTVPADAESPRQGAARIRALTLNLLSLLSQGGGSAVTFSNPPLSVDTSGNVTIPTTLTVPTPTAPGQAVNLGYITSSGTPAPSVQTTFANTVFNPGDSKILFNVNSTPPGTTKLYRAVVSATVFFLNNAAGPGSATNGLMMLLSDSASLFTQQPTAQTQFSSQFAFYLSLSVFGISNVTRTGNAGAVTFTLTGFSAAASNQTVTAKTASDLSANAKSYLSVTWIPAQ